jgi:hypothetical protein
MNDKRRHFARNYKNHVDKCKVNNGKIIKEIKLDKTPMPFIPHLNNKEMLNSIVKNIPYKYSRNYIVYDFETGGVRVNEKFGKKSELITYLEPIMVASVVYNNGIKEPKCFSIRNSLNFVNDWFEYLFDRASKMTTESNDSNDEEKEENEFKKQWINVIGFNSAKFDFILLLPFL